MEADNTISSIEKIESHWEKKRGLLYTFILITIVYFCVCSFIDGSYSLNKTYNIILPIIFIIVFIIWIVTTNRIPLKRADQLGVFISISCDQDVELKVKALFSSLLEQIKKDNALKLIWVRLLPINYFKTTSEVKDWTKKIAEDNIILFLDIKSGKENAEEKININSISYTGYFKKDNITINSSEKLNIISDLELRTKNKDLSYIEKNSYHDKDKLRNNVKDLIIYYAGIFSLNEGNFENARIILKHLYDPSATKVKTEIDQTNTSGVKVNLMAEHVQAARLNYLLINLYLTCVINRLKENKHQEAIDLLKEIENYDTSPELQLKIYTNLAYFYYLTDKIELSKQYNEKIHLINPKSFAYLINMGFYAIIENDPISLAKYYSIMDENNQELDSQPVEIIGFLSDHQNKHPASFILFEIAQAALTKMFVEEEEGNNKLKSIIDKIPSSSNYKTIKRFCEKKLKTKWPKKIQRQRHKGKNTM